MKKTAEDREIDYDIMLETAHKDLAYAKKAVQDMLDDPNCSVDFHSLEHWAGRVERLRELIKNSL